MWTAGRYDAPQRSPTLRDGDSRVGPNVLERRPADAAVDWSSDRNDEEV